MKTINQAVKELEQLVEQELPRYAIPYKQGRTIRIGKTIVRRSERHGYTVVDTEDNAIVSYAFSKHGAVAIAKAYNDDMMLEPLQQKDKQVQKHFNDSVFFQNNIEKTTDDFKKAVLEDRLDISQAELDGAYRSLEKFILAI